MLKPMRRAMVIAITMLLAVPAAADNNAAVPQVSFAEAVRASLERGREARIAGHDVRIAEERRARAGARYLPRVDAGADYTALSEPPSIFIQGREVQTMDQNVARARVTAEQTIYDFGKTSSRVSQAAARRDAAEGQADATRARAAMDAIAAFLSARRAEELAGVAAESLETAREHRKVAGDQYELGVVARNDVLAADVQVANAEAALIAARNRVEIERSRLALRMGYPGDRAVAPAPGDFPVPPEASPSLDESVRAAAEARPEIRAQAALVREAEASAASARSEFGPTLFGQGGYSYETNDYNPHKSVFSLLAGGKVNLFAGGGDAAARREALISVDRRKEGLALLGDEIALAVKTAHLAIVEADKRKAVAGTAVARAEENLRIQNDRYREGLAISTEVLDAETLHTRAKVDLRNATYDLFEARYRLLYARGELLESLRPLIGGAPPPAAAPAGR
ncbi:MAG: TolC family protein [Deltaproteobacteria bacterium]